MALSVSAPATFIEGLDVEGLSGMALGGATLEVTYGDKKLDYGGGAKWMMELAPPMSKTCPALKLSGGEAGSKYVVIMTDPDAPSKDLPLFREFIHWVVTEVPLDGDALAVDKGNTCVPWVGFAPPCKSGLHRYIVLVYKQAGADPAESLKIALGDRGGKKAAMAAKEAGLGDPIAFGACEAQWDESVDALHEAIGFLPPPQYRSPKQIAANPIPLAPADAIEGLDVEGLSCAALGGGATLEVNYGGTTLDYGSGGGMELAPPMSKAAPTLKLSGGEVGSKYVVIMTDPDAPSKDLPLFREFIHWVVTEVPLDDDSLAVDKGNTCVPWVGFAPPCKSGLHRYIVLVYKQAGADPAESLKAALGDRGGKKAALAAKEAGLGDPIAFGFCVAQWDESVDALHEAIGFFPPPEYRSPKQLAANP
jgi:phosphatidylethanolamine-binding protein (PEBP) family uncharacterized protein